MALSSSNTHPFDGAIYVDVKWSRFEAGRGHFMSESSRLKQFSRIVAKADAVGSIKAEIQAGGIVSDTSNLYTCRTIM